MPITLVLGGVSYQTKVAVKLICKQLLSDTQPGSPVDWAWVPFLTDLLHRHHDAVGKIGCGIHGFRVDRDGQWGKGKHFTVIRTDGSFTDFSYHTCLDGESIKKDATAALRQAITPQIMEFKKAAFRDTDTVPCALTGVATTFNTCHVDHEHPTTFAVLLKEWLRRQSLTLEQISVTPSRDNQWTCEMTDPAQIGSWQDFHAGMASLRITSPEANAKAIK